MDRLGEQTSDEYKDHLADPEPCVMMPAYTPGDCTDLCAVTDDDLGKLERDIVKRKFEADLDANQKDWTEGCISESQFRVRIVNWASEAREEMAARHKQLIEDKFKECGMYNALDGSENGKLKVRGLGNLRMRRMQKDEENAEGRNDIGAEERISSSDDDSTTSSNSTSSVSDSD